MNTLCGTSGERECLYNGGESAFHCWELSQQTDLWTGQQSCDHDLCFLLSDNAAYTTKFCHTAHVCDMVN